MMDFGDVRAVILSWTVKDMNGNVRIAITKVATKMMWKDALHAALQTSMGPAAIAADIRAIWNGSESRPTCSTTTDRVQITYFSRCV